MSPGEHYVMAAERQVLGQFRERRCRSTDQYLQESRGEPSQLSYLEYARPEGPRSGDTKDENVGLAR